MNTFNTHLKNIEKKQQTNPTRSIRMEIVKTRPQTNYRKAQKAVQKINETRSWLFETINKIEEFLIRLMEGKENIL